jgi:hypothetical protein
VLPRLMDTVGVVVSSSLLDTRSVFRIFSFFCAFRILLGFGVEAWRYCREGWSSLGWFFKNPVLFLGFVQLHSLVFKLFVSFFVVVSMLSCLEVK